MARNLPAFVKQALRENRPLTVAEVRRLTKPKPPTERVEVAHAVRWARAHSDVHPDLASLAAVPNAEQSDTQRTRKWEEGVSAGYPDLLLDVARGGWHGLRIEAKRLAYYGKKQGEPTDDQLGWHTRLYAQGFLVLVCWGTDAIRNSLLWYLAQPYTGIHAWVGLRRVPTIVHVRGPYHES